MLDLVLFSQKMMLVLKIESLEAFIAPKAFETLWNDFGVAANSAGWNGRLSYRLCETFALQQKT